MSDLSFNHMDSAYLEAPYPTYANARQGEPVFFNPALQAWVVTRYKDVMQMIRESNRFSSDFFFCTPDNPKTETTAVWDQCPPETPTPLKQDPPMHTNQPITYLSNSFHGALKNLPVHW